MAADPKEPLVFRDAPEVAELAKALIKQYHKHLKGREIKYLFRSEPEIIAGKECFGTARKVSGLNAFLAGSTLEHLGSLTTGEGEEPKPFFLMQVWDFGWSQLTGSQQIALVDHELMHFDVEDGKLKIAPHDLEEFVAIVERHGLWEPNIKAIVDAAERNKQQEALINGAVDSEPRSFGEMGLTNGSDAARDFAAMGAVSISHNGKTVAACPLDADTLVEEAAYYVVSSGSCAARDIQARFSCGKDRAARIVKALESLGVLESGELKAKTAPAVKKLIDQMRESKAKLQGVTGA